VIGRARAAALKGRHVIVSAIEHDAVRHAADALEREGLHGDPVAPDSQGVVHAEGVAEAIRATRRWCRSWPRTTRPA